MKTTESHETEFCDEDYFSGTEGTHPNSIYSITEEQARQLLEGFDSPERRPAPALVALFEQRRRNQERSAFKTKL